MIANATCGHSRQMLPATADHKCGSPYRDSSSIRNRLSSYFVSTNRARTHWLLWSRWYDDDECKWRDALCAYGPKKGVPEKAAATYLLFEDLRRDAEAGKLDRFHWIGAEGLLSVPELLAIAREVWP